MSKERELLERVISGDDDGDFFISHRLYIDIETFLAQPEQEPDAWIIEWVQRYRHNDTPIMGRDLSFTKGDAPAVPNPNYTPLYLAPPKRGPLSDEAVCEILVKKEWKGFVDLVRIIEKAHGITGGG